MKHVFLVNSHTTFFSSLGIINYLKLHQKDVIYLMHRNYSQKIVKTDALIYSVDNFYKKCDFRLYDCSYKERKRIVKEIDSYVEEFIGEPYHLYGPHLGNPLYQLFYTNKLCMQFAYMQEGAIVYNTAFITNQSFCKRFIKRIYQYVKFGTKRIWMGGYYMTGCQKRGHKLISFALNNEIYKNLPSENYIIKWPKLDMNITIKHDSEFFIFDGFVNNGMVEADFYMNCCKAMIEKYARKYNYLKFHPNESQEERAILKSYFDSHNFEYEVIEDNIPFELYLISKSNLNIVGLGSSLLYFGKDLGHNSINLVSWLDKSPLYCQYKKVIL